MFSAVYRLREHGVLRTALPPPREQWTRGVFDFSTGETDLVPHGRRRLVVHSAGSAPDRGILIELFQPAVVGMRDQCLHLRGVEPVRLNSGSISMMLQEWLVDFHWTPRGPGR